MRRLLLVLAVVVSGVGCGDDEITFDPDTVTAPAPSTSTTTTSTTTTLPPTTLAPTTTEPFEGPPPTEVDPARAELAGLWRWTGTHTRYLQLQDHGAIATGAIVDDTLQLTRTGRWEIEAGVMEIRFLQAGGVCDNEAIGSYEVTRSGRELRMSVIDDDCPNRAVWLIGSDRTRRLWIEADV